jgi:quinol monooxygenase YgiN
MGRVVIVAMTAKPGCNERLRELVAGHVPRLRAQGLATEREPIIVEGVDGTLVEVFEWKSREAIESAHGNEAVLAMWAEFAEVCEFAPVASLAEAAALFSEFDALN